MLQSQNSSKKKVAKSDKETAKEVVIEKTSQNKPSPKKKQKKSIKKEKTVLVTGIGRKIGRLVAKRLDRSYNVIGIGKKGWSGGKPRSIKAHAIELDRNRAEDYFRRQPIDTVVHLEYVHSPKLSSSTRYRVNVGGTMRLLEFCRKYGVKKVIVLSTSHIYGAAPENHAYIGEDDPAIAEQDYSALQQVIEVDTYVRSWMYRYPEIKTIILRPCNIIGPTVNNSMVQYLTRDFCPTLFGFDPMMQFIHEEDFVEAVAEAVANDEATGPFNIAGIDVIPLSKAINEAGGKVVPIFHPFVYFSIDILWAIGLSWLPSPEVDYLRYPCIVSTERAEKILGFHPQYSLLETLRCLRDRRVFAKH